MSQTVQNVDESTNKVEWTGGAQANAWNAVAVAAGGASAVLDTWHLPFVTAFGNASAATTITLQVSQDNVNWYNSQVAQTLSAAGNFCLITEMGARYVRLTSSAAATITATITAKR